MNFRPHTDYEVYVEGRLVFCGTAVGARLVFTRLQMNPERPIDLVKVTRTRCAVAKEWISLDVKI